MVQRSLRSSVLSRRESTRAPPSTRDPFSRPVFRTPTRTNYTRDHGTGRNTRWRCEECDTGFVHLTKRVSADEIKRNRAAAQANPVAFNIECKHEGRARLTVHQEMREKGNTANSHAGTMYKKARLGQLRQEVHMVREVRKEGPGIMILPERAWIAHVKREEGYDRIINGLEEAKIMWNDAVATHGLQRNEYGEMGLPISVRGKTQTSDSITKASTFVASKEDVTDENVACSDLRLEKPLTGPSAVGDSLFTHVGGASLMNGLSPAHYAPTGLDSTTASSSTDGRMTAMGSIIQAFAISTGRAASEDSGTPAASSLRGPALGGEMPPPNITPVRKDSTPAELQALQKNCRERINRATKATTGVRGLFQQTRDLYEGVKEHISTDTAIAALRTLDWVKEGEEIVRSLEGTRNVINVWSCRNAAERAAAVDVLLEKLDQVKAQLIEDQTVCKYRKTQDSQQNARKKRRQAKETKKLAEVLGGTFGDMTQPLIDLCRACLEDPASFVQKGVVQDPEEMTQDAMGKCVLFGWNGVLIIADMCHRLLMMLVTRRWGHPNPNPDSLRRRVPDLRNSRPCRGMGVCHVEFHRLE